MTGPLRNPAPLAEYLGLETASQITDPRIPIPTLRYWLATGRLRRHKVGRRVYVRRRDLLALLEGDGVTP